MLIRWLLSRLRGCNIETVGTVLTSEKKGLSPSKDARESVVLDKTTKAVLGHCFAVLYAFGAFLGVPTG
jgi:hypothetical protein